MKIPLCKYLYFLELCKSREKPSRMKHFYLAKSHPFPEHQIFKNNLRNFQFIISKKLPPPLPSSPSCPTLTPLTKCISKHTVSAH